MTRARRPWLYFGPAALVAGALAVALTAASDHEQHPAVATALVLLSRDVRTLERRSVPEPAAAAVSAPAP